MMSGRANVNQLLWAALFFVVTIPFLASAYVQKSRNKKSGLQAGNKWPYKQPVFQNGKLYGRFHFSEGLAKIIYQQYAGFVDSTYTIIITPEFEDKRDHKRYYSSVVFDPVSELYYKDAYIFKNKRAIVQKNNKWGVIDKEGKTVVPFQYEYIHRLLGNYFQVHLKNEFDFIVSGILDQNGTELLPVQYSWPATPFTSEAELQTESLKAREAVNHKKQLKISERQAIEIASNAGFYQQNNWLHPPQVIVTSDGQWQISSLLVGYSKAGKCKYTNGCTTTERKTIVINSATGEVLDKSVSRTEHPNYER